jgi:hypothetical protein
MCGRRVQLQQPLLVYGLCCWLLLPEWCKCYRLQPCHVCTVCRRSSASRSVQQCLCAGHQCIPISAAALSTCSHHNCGTCRCKPQQFVVTAAAAFRLCPTHCILLLPAACWLCLLGSPCRACCPLAPTAQQRTHGRGGRHQGSRCQGHSLQQRCIPRGLCKQKHRT